VGKQSAAQSNPQGEEAEITCLHNAMYTTNHWHYAIR
jgi:hypothetical protein